MIQPIASLIAPSPNKLQMLAANDGDVDGFEQAVQLTSIAPQRSSMRTS